MHLTWRKTDYRPSPGGKNKMTTPLDFLDREPEAYPRMFVGDT